MLLLVSSIFAAHELHTIRTCHTSSDTEERIETHNGYIELRYCREPYPCGSTSEPSKQEKPL